MKAAFLGTILTISAVAIGLSGEARAVTTDGHMYSFYNGTQLIGQSILFCNNQTRHWGDASRYNLANAVTSTYSCETRATIYIGYPAGIDPSAKANFCDTTDACDGGPDPAPNSPALQNGYYSD